MIRAVPDPSALRKRVLDTRTATIRIGSRHDVYAFGAGRSSQIAIERR